MLITVLVITAVGLMFGAGALLLFRYQCQRRIDRQHELEKVYAVRSALNYIRTNTLAVPDTGVPLRYQTGSGRNLGLLVKPVEPIFPDSSNPLHFDLTNSFHHVTPNRAFGSGTRDYEYGAYGVTNVWLGKQRNSTDTNVSGGKISDKMGYGLAFNDLTPTNNLRCWVNIGMYGTGGWLQEDYGRRYSFFPLDYVRGDHTNDIVRLCIIRSITNDTARAGLQHGWPLSNSEEKALVLEIQSFQGNTTNNATLVCYEYEYGKSPNPRIVWRNRPSLVNMGLQIANDKISIFYVENEGANSDLDKQSAHGYMFSESVTLSTSFYDYFAKKVMIGGKEYMGISTNHITGRVEAPELRAVFEVESNADTRRPGQIINVQEQNFITKFRVTPAYQYDVFIEHPTMVTNRATVAQKIGNYSRGGKGTVNGLNYTILTYDTHGTDHKGFRQDEREYARRNDR